MNWTGKDQLLWQPTIEFPTLVELLRWRALWQPEQRAYTFLLDGVEGPCLTYRELDRQARAIAAQLQSCVGIGERVLLLYPPGLEFTAAFFGCLYAGVIAVPAYPPQLNRPMPRLQAIVADAQAQAVLTTAQIVSNGKRLFTHTPELESLRWIATDQISVELADNWREVAIVPDTLAFLQYTSGSTGTPKGVMVNHNNLIHNEKLIQQAMQHTEKTIFVGWLPLFHDMGLIGNMLQPLYLGIPCILMAPMTFLQNPFRWLQAISDYKATTSGGPNFAYDLCVHKITPEQKQTLDLSSWDVAFTGAEPIRAETLDRFAAAFEPYGFRREAFYPCYGMAETTLIVSGGLKPALPVLQSVPGTALEQNRVRSIECADIAAQTIVGCGQPLQELQVVIAHPETLTRCASDEVGEVWVAGPSVAQGYWNRAEQTETTFQAYLKDTGEGPFFRTGDLGFLQLGELFITGRLKDLIIIRGRNHYPQDIEWTVENSHSTLQLGSGAAFAVDVAGEEQLVVAQEVKRSSIRNLNVDNVVGSIRQAVSAQHGLQVYAVLLIKTGSIPKTSSGKIQRHACRIGFLNNSLSVVASSTLDQIDEREDENITQESSQATPQSQRQLLLELDLRNQIAQLLKLAPSQLDPQQPLTTLGLDSLKAVEVKNHLETNYGLALPMEAFLEDINVAQLADLILSNVTLPASDSSVVKPSSIDIASIISPSTSTPTIKSLRKPESFKKQLPSDSTIDLQNLAAKQDLQFSLFYFSSNEAEFKTDKYQLLIEGTKFADRHGFSAVWVAERHFHAFGGLYPNPSVLGAALAMVTERIRLRAGSVVLPLHSPVRVAEEWSVVDNLSQGRVDLAFARGWNPNDFVISPDTYTNRTEVMYSGIETVQKLWRGETITLPNGVGKPTEIKIYPLPKQQEVSVWITCSGGKERFAEAGASGANILTALLFQPIEELAEKLALYREARATNGHDPETGHVTLMLHTFVGEDLTVVRNQVREPFTEYLKTSVDLWRNGSKNLDDLTEKEREDLLAYAFERYFQTTALFGTPESCLKMVSRLKEIGVSEIACLIDFGVDIDLVMASLYTLKRLKDNFNTHFDLDDSKDQYSHSSTIAVDLPLEKIGGSDDKSGREEQCLRHLPILSPPYQAKNFSPAPTHVYASHHKIDQNHAAQLLNQLDKLSEQEVNSLLTEMLAAKEVGK